MAMARWLVGAMALAVAAGVWTPSAAGAAAPKGTSPAESSSAPPASLQCPQGTGTASPGVSSHEIDVAAISTLSGPLSADFGALVPGMKAYFETVDRHGGIHGRKIVLAHELDDAGIPSQFASATHTAIDQDHAFAVAVSSYWFTPTYFVSTCTPTFGYNVAGNWAGAPNLFAAGGSVQTYATIVPSVAYLVDKTKSKSVAVLAYGVSTSSDLCRTTVNRLRGAGYDVSFSDLKIPPIGADLTPDVQRIQQAGADFVVSCMTVTGNIAMARAIAQYGLAVKQLWFDGADKSVVKKYSSLMQGVYFSVQHVPIPAAARYPGVYPGLKAYLKAMERYAPSYVGNELAMQGWESAALMVAGMKAAGPQLTQASLVAATNRLTDFTAGGLMSPVDWSHDHTTVTSVNCTAFEQVRGTSVMTALGKGKQVFLCFTRKKVRHPEPTSAPRGLPGPAKT